MDLSHVPYNVSVPKPLVLLLHIVDIIGYSISAVLFHLGLHPSFQLFPSPWDDRAISLTLTTVECVATQSSPTAPSVLKSRLPAVEYRRCRSFVRKCEETCAVCLGGFCQEDEVRELGNCRHAFHRDCIDRWIDMGKVTCPLCRLEMVPAEQRGGLGLLFLSIIVKKLRCIWNCNFHVV